MEHRSNLLKKRIPSKAKGVIQNFNSRRFRKKRNACYVLITCEEPNSDGKMHVEMTYEGDTYLAAYLLENAQSILDDRIISQ
ncbi:MAG: hypothetical protein L0207_03050 [Chlamydiae bacterium]|nr:hypothetical protein [Chlamydiota bacterium]